MKGDDIAERLLEFSAQVLRIVGELPADRRARHVAQQLMRAGTSGGANYEEARSAESRADFAHKALVAAKELAEAVYWLKLLLRCGLTRRADVPQVIDEGRQLVAILKASARTARSSVGAST